MMIRRGAAFHRVTPALLLLVQSQIDLNRPTSYWDQRLQRKHIGDVQRIIHLDVDEIVHQLFGRIGPAEFEIEVGE